MSKARDRFVERRLSSTHAHRRKPRRISMFSQGRVLTGHASQHRQRTGQLYRLRVRIWRKFHTVPMIMGSDPYPWSSLKHGG